MTDKTSNPLARELRGAVPPGLDRLETPALQHLADAVRSARQAQKKDLAQALEAALSHIPALLRGPVRRILLPEQRR